MLNNFLVAFLICSSASGQLISISIGAQKQQQSKTEFVATVVSPSGDANGVLSVYIRSCGQVALFKNADDELPKVGQKVLITLGGRCKIESWRPLN